MIEVKKIAHLTGHNGAIYCLAYYKENRFFSAGFDNIIVEWNINDVSKAKVVAKLKSKAISLLYIKQRNWLIAGQSTGGVHIIDLTIKKEIHLLQVHEDMVFALCYDKSNENLFVGGADGKLSVWDLKTMKMISVKTYNYGKIREIKINENQMYVGFGDGRIITMTHDLKELLTIKEHAHDFSVNTLLVDNDMVLSGSRDGHLNLIKVKDLEYTIIDKIPAHNFAIYKIVKSPNGQYIATASRDKSIKIWDYQTMKVVKKIDFKSNKGHTASVNDIIWIDNHLVSTGDDRSVVVWEFLISN